MAVRSLRQPIDNGIVRAVHVYSAGLRDPLDRASQNQGRYVAGIKKNATNGRVKRALPLEHQRCQQTVREQQKWEGRKPPERRMSIGGHGDGPFAPPPPRDDVEGTHCRDRHDKSHRPWPRIAFLARVIGRSRRFAAQNRATFIGGTSPASSAVL